MFVKKDKLEPYLKHSTILKDMGFIADYTVFTEGGQSLVSVPQHLCHMPMNSHIQYRKLMTLDRNKAMHT